MIDIIDNLNNRLKEYKLQYGDRRTIILIDMKLKDFFLENLKNKFLGIDIHVYYKRETKNVLSSFKGVPLEYVLDMKERLMQIFYEFDNVIVLRNKYFFETIDKKDFEEYLRHSKAFGTFGLIAKKDGKEKGYINIEDLIS